MRDMTKGIILIGIIACLVSITVATYSCLFKKQSKKEVLSYLKATLGIGVLVALSGVLVNSLANFDIDFSSYKRSIPIGYIISLFVFFTFSKRK